MRCLDNNDFLWIFIGGRDEAKNLQQLRRNRIKYILNVTPILKEGGVANYHERDPNFCYCRISIEDRIMEKLSSHYQTAWEFFELARIREDGNLLVHCHMGVSRSVAIVCSYLIKYYRFTLDNALNLIRESRQFARPNDGFVEQLNELQEKLRLTGDYANPAKGISTNRQTVKVTRRRPIGPMRPELANADVPVVPNSIGPSLPRKMDSQTSADNGR